jgi:hypothetical protein
MNTQRTLEQLVNLPKLQNNQQVKVRIPDVNGYSHFSGKIVGLSSMTLMPYYIVECMDGRFPNKIYPYKFLSLPLSEIFIDE